MMRRLWIALFVLVLLPGCAILRPGVDSRDLSPAQRSVAVTERTGAWIDACLDGFCGTRIDPGSAVDTVRVTADSTLIIEMNEAFAQIPFRESAVDSLRAGLQTTLGHLADGFDLEVRALGLEMRELVPNVYRTGDIDTSRRPESPTPGRFLVQNADAPWRGAAALGGRHVAVWPSHGWYYEGSLDRWEWQRARLFRTVEDLLPMSFVVPYLTPMLERAGAYVHIPRERDTQTHQVIVDNDSDGSSGIYVESGDWVDGRAGGFADEPPYTDGENPFEAGTYRLLRSGAASESEPLVIWTPEIPERGTYHVSVAWGRSDDPARAAQYDVKHLGGSTRLQVDQSMAAGTWVYLGAFEFDEGTNPETGSVRLTNGGAGDLTADAVRFGGGMGSIERGGATSGRPRFTEGARYYMQFAGMPQYLVYNITESPNDYVDDYRGRAEWVNYLRGAPYGPNKDRETEGLGVPIDVSLAFHTDAGIAGPDTTIGTLMIYASEGMDESRTFPDGMSRFANRDLGDLMQTVLVDDIRALYDSTWSRRAIWDRDYSEAVRPNVPGVLLELLSHQNQEDMSYALDPRFRFDVARSIYKSIARFIATQNGEPYVVQPLPPDHLAAEITPDGSIRVTWEPVMDRLEPSANPDRYVVYVRAGESAYGLGRIVNEPRFTLERPERGVVYGFRVTAINDGGESMPSEEVAAGLAPVDAVPAGAMDRMGHALIVAGFDRISAPAEVVQPDFSGFAGFLDEGVPDGRDVAYVGDQYDFDRDSPWLDDDSPGHGASYSTFETQLITGNTFNYPAVHGRALMDAGWSFSTVSDERYESMTDTGRFDVVDLILGEERTTHGPGRLTAFEAVPPAVRATLASYADAGGRIMISGAHFATDLAGPGASEEAKEFASRVLGLRWRTDHAVERGEVITLPGTLPAPPVIHYNTDPVADIYRVESPDALAPGENAAMLMRYADNNMTAAVGRPGERGVVAFGFPLETVTDVATRHALFRAALEYLFSSP